MKKTGELVNRLSSDCTLIGKTLVDNMAHGIRRIIEGIGGLFGKNFISLSPSRIIFFF
jgi:hypothetical protein